MRGWLPGGGGILWQVPAGIRLALLRDLQEFPAFVSTDRKSASYLRFPLGFRVSSGANGTAKCRLSSGLCGFPEGQVTPRAARTYTRADACSGAALRERVREEEGEAGSERDG